MTEYHRGQRGCRLPARDPQLGFGEQGRRAYRRTGGMRDTLRPVAFQHLRKTAGTSLADTLRLFFRPERAIAADDHLPEDVSIQNVLASFRNHDFVTGHVEFLSCARADAFKVAVFRNPLARLLSERRQWMQARPENIAAAPANVANTIVALQQRSITEILESVF